MRKLSFVLLPVSILIGVGALVVWRAGWTCHECPSDVQHARTQMAMFATAIGMYRYVHGSLPTSLHEIEEMDEVTGEPYLECIPLDPWANPYELRLLGGDGFQLLSYGEDGRRGTADDILWPEE